jgi:AraC-like DNA-binding protein
VVDDDVAPVLGPAGAGPPLQRFSMMRASGVTALEQARAVVAQLLTPFRLTLLTTGTQMAATIAAVDLGPVSLVHAYTGGHEVHVRLTEQVSYYDVNFALAGRNRLDCGDDQVLVTPMTAGIISPGAVARMQLSDGYSQLHLRIERAALERRLEQLLGRPVAGPVRFRPRMDLAEPAVASWVRAVRLLVRDLDEPSGLGGLGVGQNPWPDFIITGLLLAQPHDYSEQLEQRRAGACYPLPVQRVVDLIDRDPAGDLSLARLSRVAGVGARTLQRNFRAHVGVPPRDYVQLIRLGRARSDLVAGAGATVAEIAFRWGFSHVPRFAGAFLERYGEPPSTVLRRARAGTGEQIAVPARAAHPS